VWCEESTNHDSLISPTFMMDGTKRWMHDDCALRQVLGGIGHLVAHEYWCVQHGDPDAGLTYRQSALLVYQWTQIVGVDSVTPGGSISS
jgi:hypothetical protein